jgi:hypothetical protein
MRRRSSKKCVLKARPKENTEHEAGGGRGASVRSCPGGNEEFIYDDRPRSNHICSRLRLTEELSTQTQGTASILIHQQ